MHHLERAVRAFERHGTRTRTQVVNAGSTNETFSLLLLSGAIQPVGSTPTAAVVYSLA